jgi:hypothetical protein
MSITSSPNRRKVNSTARRTVNLSDAVPGSPFRILAISIEKPRSFEVFQYWLSSLDSDFGAAYLFTKFAAIEKDGEPNEYHVNLDFERGFHTCECKGHLHHGHKTQCKHIAGLLALINAGKLPRPATTKPQSSSVCELLETL